MKTAALEFRPYRRRFIPPLVTARGVWAEREGFLLRLETEDGCAGFGEVAPLPGFGTETQAEAEACLRDWRAAPGKATTAVAPPCCAFALSSAQRQAETNPGPRREHRVAGLLPAGRAAVPRLRELTAAGFRVFKWKIGVQPGAEERALFPELAAALPEGGKLRLDANGALDETELMLWLDLPGVRQGIVEFFEQPFPPGAEEVLREFAEASPVPLALDESLHRPGGLRWLEEGTWPGPVVLKPVLLGDIDFLLGRLRMRTGPVVFSSAFETDVGLAAVLALLEDSGLAELDPGFNTSGYFDDGMNRLARGPLLPAGALSSSFFAELWNDLRPLI